MKSSFEFQTDTLAINMKRPASNNNLSTDRDVKMHACFLGEKLTDASVF